MTRSTIQRLCSAEYDFCRVDATLSDLADNLHACVGDSDAAGAVHDYVKQCRAAMPLSSFRDPRSAIYNPCLDPADPAPGPEDVAALNELVAGVRDAVASLPDRARDVVERYLLLGQKTKAVAAAAGVTRKCVYFRAQSAVRLLARGAPALAHYVGGALPAHPVATPPADSFTPGDTSFWPAMLSSERVADAVSISVRTLWRMVASGQFPQPVRFNRKLVRWRKADVVAWIEGAG